MTVRETNELDYFIRGNRCQEIDLSKKKTETKKKTKKFSIPFKTSTSKSKRHSASTNKDERRSESTVTHAEKIAEEKPTPKEKSKKAATADDKQWNILTKKPIIGKKARTQTSSKPQTKERHIQVVNKTKKDKVIERDTPDNIAYEKRQKKDSIAQMTSLLDESQIMPVEKQSGLFEEIKDSPKARKIVGGRSVFKHRNSIHLYKDGYEPGQSVLLPKSARNSITKKKSRNTGFHLSLNESTMSFLGTSIGFLEMSSGLVVNKKKTNPGFQISLDDISDVSQSGVFIKNKIFDQNNEWVVAETTPGRKKQQLNVAEEGDTGDTLVLPETDKDFYEGSPLTSSMRASTRLSFLYNKHTGFICKHCFASDCHHMQKGNDVFSSEVNVRQPEDENLIKTNIDTNHQPIVSLGNNEHSDLINAEEQQTNETLDDEEIQNLLENLLEKLNKKSNNAIELTDLAKLIRLRQVYHSDKDGNMIPYNEFVLDIDNDAPRNTIISEDSMFDQTEDEIVALCEEDSNGEGKDVVTSDGNNTTEKEFDLSGSALRFTPVIPQEGLPPMNQIPHYGKKTSQDSFKDTFYYDSDYDDASYLNACAESKTNISFEKLDVTNDLFYSNAEPDSDVPMTPPLNASSPTHPPSESISLKISKRRTSLRPLSELETVFETDEVQTFTARSSSATTTHSNALTHVTSDLLDDLIGCANDRLKETKNKEDSANNNTDPKLELDSLEKFRLPDTANMESNVARPKQSDEKQSITYSDLTLNELKALAKKHKMLKSLAQEETNVDSMKTIDEVRDEIISGLIDLDQLQNNVGFFYENAQLQVWLQDVRKQCLTGQERQELNEGVLFREECNENDDGRRNDEGAENDNYTEVQQSRVHFVNTVSSDSNTNSELSSNINPVDASYHHIDVLVLDSSASRENQNAAMSLDPSPVTTARDSGVESHGTGTSHTITRDNNLESMSNKDDEQTSESQQNSSPLEQRPNYTHDAGRDIKNTSLQSMISNTYDFSYFNHSRNITEPVNDYHAYLAEHNRHLRNFTNSKKESHVAQQPINIHEPKPPTTKKDTSKVFKRNHSTKKSIVPVINDTSTNKKAQIPRQTSMQWLPRVNSQITNHRNYITYEEELFHPYVSYSDHRLPYIAHPRNPYQEPYDSAYFLPPHPNIMPLHLRSLLTNRHDNHFYLTQSRRTLRETNYRSCERIERAERLRRKNPPYDDVYQRGNFFN